MVKSEKVAKHPILKARITKYHTEVLDSAELRQLFKACRAVRQILIVKLLFETGMRSWELLRLELKNFNKERRTIAINNAKGKKLRIVPYGSHIRQTIHASEVLYDLISPGQLTIKGSQIPG